ncbi:hypothetical protein HPB49_022364 [Dermacentor silvarum]|uniref:Uncharacterized protein n=1 Tax=Dermacentor silvarum TaxID=543639 RepID=A0ACB8DKG3_DERSI|nr:hypothetical protein HPB49_022364 [Dermacentor silvarum]
MLPHMLWISLCLALLAVLLLTLVRILNSRTVGQCTSTRDMSGKTVIITGASSGIGKATARELCRRNARVILACRDEAKARATADEIEDDTGVRPACMQLDLCSLASVRQFAHQVLAQEERLDVLINNAGTLPPPERTETEDGFEMTFQANHLGHFLLTNLLIDLLKKSAPSRIINVGSMAQVVRKSVEEGAQTSVHLAVSEESVSGKMFSDCKQSWAPRWATNPEHARMLWEASETMTGIF